MRYSVVPFAALTLLAISTPIAATHAQYTAARVGERVRVEAPGIVGGRYTGTVLRRTADTLLIGSADAPPTAVPLASITRLSVSRGRSAGAGALRGFVIGGGVGALVGLVGSIVILSEDSNAGDLAILVVPAVVVAEAAIGGAVGSAIGAVVKREVWDSYTSTDMRVGLGMHDGRLRVLLHGAF